MDTNHMNTIISPTLGWRTRFEAEIRAHGLRPRVVKATYSATAFCAAMDPGRPHWSTIWERGYYTLYPPDLEAGHPAHGSWANWLTRQGGFWEDTETPKAWGKIHGTLAAWLADKELQAECRRLGLNPHGGAL